MVEWPLQGRLVFIDIAHQGTETRACGPHVYSCQSHETVCTHTYTQHTQTSNRHIQELSLNTNTPLKQNVGVCEGTSLTIQESMQKNIFRYTHKMWNTAAVGKLNIVLLNTYLAVHVSHTHKHPHPKT